jgi:alkylated DNA repair dioxygenase AlkB
MAIQPDLFAPAATHLPEGFRYQPELVSPEEASDLAERLAGLDLRPYEFRGFLANRRAVSFGWTYGAGEGGLQRGAPIPDFLLPLRAQAATFAGLDEARLQHVLINEYRRGAGIGWHRDRPQFGEVVGVSLGAPGLLRFRRRRGQGWERAALIVESRSAYLLRGPARSDWQHSLPELDAHRYAITFRTLADWSPAGRR